MKKLLLFFAVLATALTASAENYITYTTTNELRVNLGSGAEFGAEIVSHTYENGQGKIVFDGEVTKIGDQAFFRAGSGSALASIDIPSSVTSIGSKAFANCFYLKSIVIPAGVTEIGNSAFESTLTKITSLSTTPPAAEGAFYFREHEFARCKLLVPAEAIEAYKAAEGWNKFTNIGKIRTVTPETSAFNPDKLYLLKCARGYIPAQTDENYKNYYIGTADVEKAAKFRITVQDGGYLLYNTDLGKYLTANLFNTGAPDAYVDEPSGTYNIYPATEEGGREGTWFIESRVTDYWIMLDGSAFIVTNSWRTPDDGDMWSIIEADNAQADVTFEQGGIRYTTLTDTQVQVMPKKEKYTGDIVIPETVAYDGKTYTVIAIGQDAFKASSVTSVVVPNTVTSLGQESFNARSLKTVVLGSSVNSIGLMAFLNCSLTEIVSLNTTPPTINDEFNNYNATLKVPAQAIEAYKAHPVWGKFQNIVGIDPSAITSVKGEAFSGKTFNLGGTRVGEGYRGIVIRNGKKFVQK